MMMDAQQEQVDIELPFQDVLKSGYIYGLGVGKSLWRKEYANKRVVRRRMFRPNELRAGQAPRGRARSMTRTSRTSMSSTSCGIRSART
jgi:hypothetical protein